MSNQVPNGYKETEIGVVPDEWELVRVTDITVEHKQGFYTKDSYVEDGTYLIRITDLGNPKIDFSAMPKVRIDEKTYEQFKVDDQDFLFARSGAIGRYGIVTGDNPEAVFASYIIRFRFNKQKVDNRYFGYFYESNLSLAQIQSITQGSSNININANNIKSLLITLPPLSEQRKITTILSSVDDAIHATQRIIDQTEVVKRGLMQQLLTKGIGHTTFKQTEIGEIPTEWDVKLFREACDIANGQVDPKEPPYCDMIHIAPNHIVGFIGHLDGYTTAKDDGVKSGKYQFTEEHVLFSKIRPELGKVAYPGFSGVCSADVYPISAKNGMMLPEFLKYVLLSDRFYKYSVSVSGRTGIPKVNRQDLDLFHIAIPPLGEQEKICKILRSVDDNWSANLAKKSSLMAVKSSLMQVLLTGKVRVNVDELSEVSV